MLESEKRDCYSFDTAFDTVQHSFMLHLVMRAKTLSAKQLALVLIKMGKYKKYSGYRAFQCLEPGVDYQEFKLAKEINRVDPNIIQPSKTA
jgi:hypothetical protein